MRQGAGTTVLCKPAFLPIYIVRSPRFIPSPYFIPSLQSVVRSPQAVFCTDGKMEGFLSPGTKQTVRNNELSVLSGLNLEKM